MVGSLFLLLGVAFAVPATSERAQPDAFEDGASPLLPLREQSAAERDRVASVAWSARARLALRRDDLAGALRCYERAWRSSPHLESLLPRIVLLAARLGRRDEAARYALLAASPEGLHPALLRQLAVSLAADGQWGEALLLFEMSLADAESGTPAADDVGSLLLAWEMGRLYFHTGQFEKSAAAFRRILAAMGEPSTWERHPALRSILKDDPEQAVGVLAESFLQAGAVADAESLVTKAMGQDDQAALRDWYRARIAAGQQRWDVAWDHLQPILEAPPDGLGSEPYELLAELLRRRSADPDQARGELFSRLEDLIAADGIRLPLRLFAAAQYLAAGREEDALRQLESLQQLDPSPEVLDALAAIYQRQGKLQPLLETLGLEAARTGSLDSLDAAVARIVEDPLLLGPVLELGRGASGVSPAEAEGIRLAAAWIALAAGRFEDAQVLFDQALRSEPLASTVALQSGPWLQWGLRCLVAARYEASQRALERAASLAKGPQQQALAHFYRSRALAMAGDREAARQAAEQAAELVPDSPRLLAQPAWVDYRCKRYESAAAGYRELLEALDDQRPAAEVREVLREARLTLSSLCLELGQPAEAEEWLEQVLDEFPDDIGALNDLGYLWADQGKHLERALEMVGKAVAGDPQNTAYRDSLGWVNYRLGRYQQAVHELEQASGGDEPDGVILDHLGDAYLKAGQTADAIAAWRRAARAFDKDGDPKVKSTRQKIREHRQ